MTNRALSLLRRELRAAAAAPRRARPEVDGAESEADDAPDPSHLVEPVRTADEDIVLEREIREVAAAIGLVLQRPELGVVVCNLWNPRSAVDAVHSLAMTAGVRVDLEPSPAGTGFDVVVRGR